MYFNKENRTFNIIAIKNSGRFEDYPTIIPKAEEEFKNLYKTLSNENRIRAIVYEPKKGPKHEVGYFYLGAIVNEFPTDLPEGMERIQLEGQYAYVRDEFDVTRMGELYDALARWIMNHNLERKDAQNEYMIEVYYPQDNGKEDLEVCMRIG